MGPGPAEGGRQRSLQRRLSVPQGPAVMGPQACPSHPHSLGDPGTRPRGADGGECRAEDVEGDPIRLLKDGRANTELAGAEASREIDVEVRREPEDAAQGAVSDPEAPLEE